MKQMKTRWLIFLLMMIPMSIVKAERLDIKTVVSGTLYGERLAAVTPLADGEQYAQMSKDGKQVIAYSYKTGKQTQVLFDVSTARGKKLERIDGYIMSPDGTRMLIQTETKMIYRRSFTAVYYLYSLRNNKLEPLSEGAAQQTPVFSPDGQMVAFVRENNIHLVKLLYDNAESQVTKDGKFNEIINGVPDWVNEEEFATNSSMVFTADSRQLCWVRYDERKVREFAFQWYKGLVPAKNEYADYPGFYRYKYPIAGTDNAEVSVMSYDIKSHQTRQLQVPIDNDGYVPRIMATDDASKVAVVTLNRHQDMLRIYLANPLSTMSQLVIEDKAEKYVKEETLSTIRITKSHILLASERSGNNHLYIYSMTGKLLRHTEGQALEVTTLYGIDEATGNVYFAANESPKDFRQAVNQKIYVWTATGKINCIASREGFNSAIFSANFKYLIHIWSDANHPWQYALLNQQGKQLAMLIDNKSLLDQLGKYTLGTREFFCFTTAEGVELNGWMVKPANFDANRKYPVIMYQYGGPGSQQVLNTWGIGMAGQGALLEQYLAQEGYISVCVDNRGTGGRGAAFEKSTYLQLGLLESRDQVETALWLGKQQYIDSQRIGIWGWSYGGWNTLMSMSEGRPVFRAGVAIAPVTTFRYYDTIYTERFMRTPKENAQGYDEINPFARLKNMHGALLLCHGLADDNVHFRHTAEYAEALVQADIDFKMNVYTNRNHSISGGNTRNHLFRQAISFFNSEMKK